MNVQALITNISFPKTLEELEYFVIDIGRFNVEDVLLFPIVEWTMPKWASKHDIVFFFHAKTAIQTIRHLQKELLSIPSRASFPLLMRGLEHAESLYEQYGGKIFAVGRVAGRPFYDSELDLPDLHWKGRIYAQIRNIHVFKNPIDISDFSDFILISRQSAITPVLGKDFSDLKQIIAQKNRIPAFLENAQATPLPIQKINRDNWLSLTSNFRKCFFLEMQFRKYYVDYLLSAISDKGIVFSECACYHAGLTGYADNCIRLNGNYGFVEVKLNCDAEHHLFDQLMKYINVEKNC